MDKSLYWGYIYDWNCWSTESDNAHGFGIMVSKMVATIYIFKRNISCPEIISKIRVITENILILNININIV